MSIAKKEEKSTKIYEIREKLIDRMLYDKEYEVNAINAFNEGNIEHRQNMMVERTKAHNVLTKKMTEEAQRIAGQKAVKKTAANADKSHKKAVAAQEKAESEFQKKLSKSQPDQYYHEKLKKRHLLCYDDINEITIIDIYDCLPEMIKKLINNETELPNDNLGENVNEIKTLIYIILCYFNTLLSDTCSQDILNTTVNPIKDKYKYPDDTCSGYFFNVLIKDVSPNIRKEFLKGYEKTEKDIHNLSVFSDSLKVLRHVSKLSLEKKKNYDTYKDKIINNIINNIKKIFNPIPTAAEQGSEDSQEKNISIKFDKTLLDIIDYYSTKYKKYNKLKIHLDAPLGNNIKSLTDTIINILNYLFEHKYLINLSNEEIIIKTKLEHLYKLITTQFHKKQKIDNFDRLIRENIKNNLENIMEKITEQKNHIYFDLFNKIKTIFNEEKKNIIGRLIN